MAETSASPDTHMPDTHPPDSDSSVPPTAGAPGTPGGPAPRPRRRRRWPWVVGGILLLLVLLVLLAPMILSTGLVKGMVVSRINRQLNGTLAVNDWSLGWTSGIALNGVKIDDEQGKRVVEIVSVRVPISLLAAARGNYDLGNTVIEKPNLVNFEVFPDGSNNLEKLIKDDPADKKRPKKQQTDEPTELPDISGKITINEARGTITVHPQPGERPIPTIFLDPSTVVVEIPDINQTIANQADIRYRVGQAPQGTITLRGSFDAIEDNLVNLAKLKADQTVQIAGSDLSAAAAFLQSPDGRTDLGGIANGTLQLKTDGSSAGLLDGELTVSNFTVGGAPLKGDTYKTSSLSIPVSIKMTPQGEATLIDIERLRVETEHALVDVTGRATQQALQNIAAGKAPGAEGQLAVAVSAKDLPALVHLLPNTLGLQPDVQVTSGNFSTRVDLTLANDRIVVKQVLDAVAAGTNAGKPVQLEPVHLESGVTAIPAAGGAGGTIPDLRDIVMNLTSAFATIKGGGASLAALNINGEMDLARLRQQIGQFVDFGTLDFAGTGDFAIASKGDLTQAGGTADVTANVNFANVVVRGLAADKPEMNQSRLALTTAATLVRGPDEGQFIERIQKGTVTLQTGEAASPVVDLVLTASNVLLGKVSEKGSGPQKVSVERFELQKLSVPEMARAQQQFAAFLPADMQLSGALTATAAGAYRGDTATFDALSVNTSENFISLNKVGQGPLVVQLREGAVGGNGELAIGSDLKRLDNVLKIFGPQLQSGVLSGTLKLVGQANARTAMQLDGVINNLSVATNDQPIQNEKVTINVKANTPADFKSVVVDSAVIDSSFARTTVTKTRVNLDATPLAMVEQATVQIAVPDINKTLTVVQALMPASTQPAPADPTTQPVEPLRIGGGAVVNATVQRDSASNTLRINIPELAASKVSLVRGQRRYAFDNVINVKLSADVATEMAASTASTQPTEQIRQIRVTQLGGELGGLATLAMPEPITIANLTSDTPNANGRIELKGALEPLMRMLSVIQDQDPMPYRGDYSVAQTVASSAGQVQLTGKALVNKLVVLSADGTPAFTEERMELSNDLVADTNAKRAQIRNVALNMTSSQAAGVAIKGTVDQWDTQRKLTGMTCDLSYDLSKVWQIVQPMLSPEQQKTYEDMQLAGVYKRTFNFAGSYPASENGRELSFNESIRHLSADGAIAFDRLATNGLEIGKYELPITLREGLLTTVYANRPRAERVPPPAPCNGTGKLDLGSIVVNLAAPEPLLSIGKNQQLLREVPLNPVLADRIGKYAAFLFKDSSQASGQMSVTVLECENVPLGEVVDRPDTGRANIVLAVRELRLDGPVAQALARVAQLGREGLVGEVRDSSVTYANGKTRSDIAVFLTRKGTQVPLRFTGGIELSTLGLRDAAFSIPPELFGSDDLVRAFPRGIQLPVTGTTEAYKIADLGAIAKENIPQLLEGVLRGNDKRGSTTAPAGKDEKQDLGDILGDVIGGRKPQEPRRDGSTRDGSTTQPAPADPLGGLLDQLTGRKKDPPPAKDPPEKSPPAPRKK